MYDEGIGVQLDYRKTVEWAKKLADYYIKQLSREVTAMVNNIEEPRFFVIEIKYKEVD